MNIERIIQIHIAVLTTIGAVLLGFGQRNMTTPLLVAFVAFSSVLFTDVLNWFRVHRVVANLLAIVALFVAMGDFWRPDTQRQLLAIADLLLYLQLVLFYQRKSNRLYWQLLMLSLLQVVVAAALDVGVEFGVLLIVYALVAISTLCFFFVHREVGRVAAVSAPRRRRRGEPAVPDSAAPWRRLLERQPVSAPPAAAAALARQVAGHGLFGQIAVMGLTTLVFTLVLFFSAPRLDTAGRRGLREGTRRYVGFPSEVTLDDPGLIHTSHEPALRVRFLGAQTRAPYRVVGEPYLAGLVLTDYDYKTGIPRWRPPTGYREKLSGLLGRLADGAGPPSLTRRLREPPAGAPLVRQEIVLQPLRQPVLFSVAPAYAAPDTPDEVRFAGHRSQLVRLLGTRDPPPLEYRYALNTTGIRGGLQLDITPHANALQTTLDRVVLDLEKAELTAFDSRRFPRLKQTADEVVATLGTGVPRRAVLARALEIHFHAAGRYRYSLDQRRVPRDFRLDPIEDFVANHHTGHCEYFASALVMMLRSQGIPARLVVGFKGGEFNVVGNYHQLRQRDAHAWVEAYLEPDEVAHEVPPNADTGPAGGWLRLDPTPPTDKDKEDQLQKGLVKLADDMLDYARTLWTDYILGLTAQRQRQTIYDPVSNNADPEAWSALLARLVREQGFVRDWLRRVSSGWWALLLIPLVAFLATLSAVRFATRPTVAPVLAGTVRRWRSRLTGQPPEELGRGAARRVAFYQQFESLLAKRGLVRGAGQTPREFADRLGALPAPETGGGLSAMAVLIVAAFYRVRYGPGELTGDELAAIQHVLAGLEQEVSPPPATTAAG